MYEELEGIIPIPDGTTLKLKHSNSNLGESTLTVTSLGDMLCNVINGVITIEGDFQIVDISRSDKL